MLPNMEVRVRVGASDPEFPTPLIPGGDLLSPRMVHLSF